MPGGLSRRRFLAASGATAVLVAAGCSSDDGPDAALSDDRPVLIVGAGLAGMTAAYRLNQAGRMPRLGKANPRWRSGSAESIII